jgi:hypothetical protein
VPEEWVTINGTDVRGKYFFMPFKWHNFEIIHIQLRLHGDGRHFLLAIFGNWNIQWANEVINNNFTHGTAGLSSISTTQGIYNWLWEKVPNGCHWEVAQILNIFLVMCINEAIFPRVKTVFLQPQENNHLVIRDVSCIHAASPNFPFLPFC